MMLFKKLLPERNANPPKWFRAWVLWMQELNIPGTSAKIFGNPLPIL